MEVEQVFHMNGGLGETSYAKNSSLQRVVISKVKSSVEESIIEFCTYHCTVFPECLRTADLGCSSGPNTLTVVSEIIDTIDSTCLRLNKKSPIIQVFLNDLPGNDFNTIFQSLPRFYERLKKEKGDKSRPCFIAAMPGSFYGRLFPHNSMHFIHSSYSLHWLRQVPKGLVNERGEALNKGNIYISRKSPREVLQAYLNEFEQGFALFLRCRSEEMLPACSMILTVVGRVDNPHNSIMEVLGRALNDMVIEGVIEEERLDNFNLPYYTPSPKEVRKVIEQEGSFSLQKLEIFKTGWDIGFTEAGEEKSSSYDTRKRGHYVSNYMRAILEPILVIEFGESLMDDLFRRFTDKVSESMEKENWAFTNLVISLTKNKIST